jgi:hypothetical protein
VKRVGVEYSEVKSFLFRELQFGSCKSLILEADIWDTGIFREPRVREISTVENRSQATTGEASGMKRLSTCCIELQSV